MGHTNYWMVHNDKCQGAYNLAKDEMKTFMHFCLLKDKTLLNIQRRIDPISEEPINDVMFNGIGDEACEDFHMPELISEVFNDSFPFCKTNERDYDYVVVGCLFILKKYLGTAVTISSDGFQHKSITPGCTEYCDDCIKFAYKRFKEFQEIAPNGWNSGGILPIFKKGKK